MLAAQISIDNLKKDQLESYYSYLKKCGLDILLISCCEFFCEGEERAEILTRMRRAIKYYEEKGLQVIVWTSSLGYGGKRGEDFHSLFPTFTGLTDFMGRSVDAVCTLDKNYVSYMKRNVRDFIKAGAKTILWDDDLVQSVRPGLVCCCEKHLKAFEERTGKKLTPKECEALFTGEPSPERTAYLDLMGDSLNSFCREMREAADELNPNVNMGLCASFTHFDIDGVHMGDTVRLLAGKDCKPLLRLSGAPYWASFAPRYKGNSLAGVMEFVKMQYGWYEGSSITLMDENDCYPHDDRIVPAAFSELYDKVMLTLPELIRHKYILCFSPDSGCRRYMEAHISDMDDDEKISTLISGLSPAGLRIYQYEHLLRGAKLPPEYPGNGKMFERFTQPFAGIFAALNSFPTKYTGGGAGMVFGENARYLNDEELSAGLILDMKAALILRERGVDVGFENAVTLKNNPTAESFGASEEHFEEADGVFYSVTLKENARVLSTFKTNEQNIPACWTYTDALGRSFAVYAFDGETLTYGVTGGAPGAVFSASRQRQLNEIYEFLSGKSLPFLIIGQPGLYMQYLCDANGSEAAFVFCNISPDRLFRTEITTDTEYELAGQLYEKQWSTENGRLNCAGMQPYSYTAFRIKKANKQQ